MLSNLITPHGGNIIDCRLDERERLIALEKAQNLPSLTLSNRNIADLECITTGAYSPLMGFADENEYYSIIKEMRLPSGLAWTISVTLQISESIASLYQLDISGI